MSTYIIACGGTGGHLAPGIALAEHLQGRGHRSLLLISEKSIDGQITAKYPAMRFARIPGAPLHATPSGVLRFALKQLQGLLFALRLVRREKPIMIVGFGGFTTAAIIVAGWMSRVPVVLHEANRVPGRAVRALARFARRIYLPRGVGLPEARLAKVRHAGLPVRAEISRQPRGESAERFGLDPNRRTVAVLGGSQGAAALNSWAETAAPLLAAQGVQLLCVTGPGKGEARLQRHPGPGGAEIAAVTLPFCDQMAACYSVADLVVSRSGAGTLAELVACGIPAVLVPYPFAADNHQLANALEFVSRGGGRIVLETEIANLQATVETLIASEATLSEMRSNVAHIGRFSTLDLMLEDMDMLARRPASALSRTPWPLHA